VVEFSESVLSHLLSYRQLDAVAPEAGGILLGRLIIGSEDIVVDQALGPSSEDRRRRCSFFRARRPAQSLVDHAWKNSKQTLNYLGEWHTHPEADPSPSGTDRQDWSRIAAEATFEQSSLLFVIVGRIHLRVWEVPKVTRRPILLSSI
jgi:integrative and conjugative element protein (TIGR02256 family)